MGTWESIKSAEMWLYLMLNTCIRCNPDVMYLITGGKIKADTCGVFILIVFISKAVTSVPFCAVLRG